MANESSTSSKNDYIVISLEQLKELAKRAFNFNDITDFSDKELTEIATALNQVIQKLKIDAVPFMTIEEGSYQSVMFYTALDGFVSRAANDQSLIINQKLLEGNLEALQDELNPKKNQEIHGAQNNLDYLGLKSKGVQAGLGYWLADTDINTALTNILDIDPKTRKAAKKYNNKDIYVAQAIDIDSLGQSFELINKNAKQPYVAYFSLNLGNRHWVSLKIEVEANKPAQITYVDGLSGDYIKQREREDKLRSIIGKIIKDPEIAVSFTGTQHDGSTCGDRSIAEILRDLNIYHPIVDAYENNNIKKLRKDVFSAIETKSTKTFKSEYIKKLSQKPIPSKSSESNISNNPDATQLNVPASETSNPKWAARETQKLVEAAYPDKESKENITKTETGCTVKYNEDEIAFSRTKNMQEAKTNSKNPETIKEMLRIISTMIDELNKELKSQGKKPIPKKVDITKIPDEETKQILIEDGQKYKPPLTIIDKTLKKENNLAEDEATKDTAEDLAPRKMVF